MSTVSRVSWNRSFCTLAPNPNRRMLEFSRSFYIFHLILIKLLKLFTLDHGRPWPWLCRQAADNKGSTLPAKRWKGRLSWWSTWSLARDMTSGSSLKPAQQGNPASAATTIPGWAIPWLNCPQNQGLSEAFHIAKSFLAMLFSLDVAKHLRGAHHREDVQHEDQQVHGGLSG